MSIEFWSFYFGRVLVKPLSITDFSCCRRSTKISRCLNLASYNYLGFAASDEYCTPRVIESLKKYSQSTCSSQVDGGGLLFCMIPCVCVSFSGTCLRLFTNVNLPSGTTVLHNKLEKYVANFVGKPAAIVFGMGYVTNSSVLPVLIGKVCTVN